ncbi:MAG TPA: DUF99 family protein [Nitrososphaeraceae archaeon]|nr:DUF99 family protein [Nitrososphaeraceae archaeon]
MRFHNYKKGMRILGIAESFHKYDRKSILAGIIMRRDFVVDGIIYSNTTIGGNDGTKKVLSMIDSLGRTDINCVLLGGLIISLFNILSGKYINEETKIPVIAISYRRSPGIKSSIHGKDEGKKIKDYLELEERKPLMLWTGKTIYVRQWGLEFSDVSDLLNSLVIQGAKPEPLRLAALAARAYRNSIG